MIVLFAGGQLYNFLQSVNDFFFIFFKLGRGIKAACSSTLCLEVLAVLILLEMFLIPLELGVWPLSSLLQAKHCSAWPLCSRGVETSWA